jgi:DNA modification methylase
MEVNKVFNEDCLVGLKRLPDNSIDCCVTSPPYYGLRDYGCSGQIGLEESPVSYINKLTDVFSEVYRVLKQEGTLWLNIGDSYNGYKGNANSKYNDSEYVGGKGFHPTRISGYGLEDKSLKPKDLIGIPWMLAFSLRNAGWYLRQDIIWHKPNPMPESVTDRCTKSHEYIFLMSKSEKYYFDQESIQEVATGYDGRKDTMMHGSKKYVIPIMSQKSPSHSSEVLVASG